MKYRKWDIWRANLDPVTGSEQGKSRPVLVVSENDINSLLNIVNIIPLAARKEGRTIYPNEALIPHSKYGLEKKSIALCHQIRTIDKKRLSNDCRTIFFVFFVPFVVTSIKMLFDRLFFEMRDI
jgi:mRNA interferase MazF